jgi:thioesterase domain-containing protein
MTEDWVRMFAVWSPPRTVHLAGVGVGCVFAAATAEALLAEGWTVPAVVLVDPVAVRPTSFDVAIADRVRLLARSLGIAAGAEPDTLESLRDALASSGRNISDAVFDEMAVRLRVAAANTVAACTATPFDSLPHVLVLSRKDVSSFGASPDGAVHRQLGADGNLSECVETFLADIEHDLLSLQRPNR